jgi:hypothetical protein
MVQQHIQQGPPGLLYHMAQTLVGARITLAVTPLRSSLSRPPSPRANKTSCM